MVGTVFLAVCFRRVLAAVDAFYHFINVLFSWKQHERTIPEGVQCNISTHTALSHYKPFSKTSLPGNGGEAT